MPPTFAMTSLGKCHVGVEFKDGRWFLDVSQQYWTVARIEISAARARAILVRRDEIRSESARAVGAVDPAGGIPTG